MLQTQRHLPELQPTSTERFWHFLRDSLDPHERDDAPEDWRSWQVELFPGHVTAEPALHHEDFWEWGWSIEAGEYQEPFIAIWPRGGAKSTSVELLCVALAARKRRRFILYVSETQDQADDHVANIGALLESKSIERHYPLLASRGVKKYGRSAGWRRNRLRTASGVTFDALGMNTAGRGIKLDETRPDFIVLDDIDSEHDGQDIVQKKITTLTTKILPTGAAHAIVVGVQNLIHADSIFSRLADGRAEFLSDREVSGPYPALDNFAFEQEADPETERMRIAITSGVPTWSGQDIEACQRYINTFGLSAFKSECQQLVDVPTGGMYNHIQFRRCRWDELPEFVRITVWVDPAISSKDGSDCMGISAAGITEDDTVYFLWSWEEVTTPEDAMRRALAKAIELGAETVGVETDQGGDTWYSVYQRVWERMQEEESSKYANRDEPEYRSAKAGARHGPKTERWQRMLIDYEHGLIVHALGTHDALESALKRLPRYKPYDLADAAYWAWHDLRRNVGADLGGVVIDF